MGYKQTILTVPSFIFGLPAFDRGLALDYLIRQLRNGGFTVNRVEPYSMYVSWVQDSRKSPSRSSSSPSPIKSEEDEIELPTLINLKKAANKYRKSA